MKKRSSITYFLLSLPAFALFVVFYLVPLVNGFYYSMLDWDGLNYNNKEFVGLGNYASIAKDYRVQSTVSFTIRYALVMLVLSLILSMVIALLLNQLTCGKSFFRTMYYMPAIISAFTINMVWARIIGSGLPAVGEALNIDWLKTNLLASVPATFWVLVVTSLWGCMCGNILLFLAALQSIPQDLLEAASLDGASSWKQFWSVKIPYILPTINMVIILSIKGGLMAFDNIFALTNGGPERSTESVGFLIYRYAFIEKKPGLSSALAIVVFIVIGILTIIQLKATGKHEVKA